MAAVVSKNLYELLGNNHDEDSDKEPEPPVKVVDKTPARTDKRSAPREAPAAPPGAGAARRGPGGNEGAFRDRAAGSSNNRNKPTDVEGGARNPASYAGRGYGGRGRGGSARAPRDDRHSRGIGGRITDKQSVHQWGGATGDAEREDENDGENQAKAEEKVAIVEDSDAPAVNAEGKTIDEEQEDNNISYADYLVQQAEKKLSLQAAATRKANEGIKEDKKWAAASELKKGDEEEFIAGSAGKAKRARERKQKEVVEIDQRFVEQPREAGRGGRGRGDGPRRGGERGAFRGERGAFRGPRGEGAPRGRGGPRGGAARGGAPRAGAAAPINTEDTNAFPSLGA